MKIGYVGDSKRENLQSARRFRLSSFTSEKFLETARLNLEGLQQNIEYAAAHHLLFYRIRSEIIPFASHPVCSISWQQEFSTQFAEIGAQIRRFDMRISFHPDQFVVINAPSEKVLQNSTKELLYQAQVLELMGLGTQHKLQIHVGGAYGDKNESIRRFILTYRDLPELIRKHLVIENDDRLYTVSDCYAIHEAVGIPIIFDNLHHALNPNGESMRDAMERCFSTWQLERDGVPMVDYSSQQADMRVGKHADHIDIKQFRQYLAESEGLDFDIMLEIKDKDVSALEALPLVQQR
jgi:UV DNA damage endonuclease